MHLCAKYGIYAMKLLNSFVSPFAARVRLAIYAYDLPVEIAPSGQWGANFQKSPDYLAINPIGLVPTLLRNDQSALPESSVIVEYLADRFAVTGLRPVDPDDLSKMRLTAYLAERYIQMPGSPLVGQIFSGHRDPDRLLSSFDAMDQGLTYLEHFMPKRDITSDHAVTIADCALVPFLYFFVECMASAFNMSSLIEKHPEVARYWNDIQKLPSVQKVLDEMTTAIANSPIKALVSGSN